MQPMLTFSFDPDATAFQVLTEVGQFYGVTVTIHGSNGATGTLIPSNIAQAVNTVGAALIAADNPAAGQTVGAAQAFSGLVNGGAGNVPAAPNAAQSSVAAGQVLTAPVANLASSQTLAPASSISAAPGALAGTALTESVTPSNPVSGERDSTGMPWDVRIHSANGTKTAKGEWRKKKGVADSLVASVEAELRTLAAIPAPVVSTAPADLIESPNRQAASEYAHAKAIEICGASPIDDETLQALLAGKSMSLPAEKGDWFVAYAACRHERYKEFIAAQQHEPMRATPPGRDSMNVAASLPPVPAALPAAPAVPTPPPVPTIPQISVADAGASFPNMMRWIAQNKLAGRIADTTVSEVAAMYGFLDPNSQAGSIAMTAQRSDYWPHIVSTLQGYGAI